MRLFGIEAIVEMKRRNPRFGCPRIAQQISKAFGIEINKNIVRRVLAKHYHPQPDGKGPSWLTFIGHMKDSLWCVDLFRHLVVIGLRKPAEKLHSAELISTDTSGKCTVVDYFSCP